MVEHLGDFVIQESSPYLMNKTSDEIGLLRLRIKYIFRCSKWRDLLFFKMFSYDCEPLMYTSTVLKKPFFKLRLKISN